MTEAAGRLVASAPRRVIATHGTSFPEADATERLRPSLAPLLHGRAGQQAVIAAAAGSAALLVEAGLRAEPRRR